MITELEKSVDRFVDAVRKVEADPSLSHYVRATFAPVRREELRTVMSVLPISDDLLVWYERNAPTVFDLSLFDRYGTLTLDDPRSLINWQTGFRWGGKDNEERYADWADGWLCIGDWYGDPVIAHTDISGTPISMKLHDYEPHPHLVAQNLSAYLSGLAISIEVTMLDNTVFPMEFDDELNDTVIDTSVIDKLQSKLKGVIDEECLDPWIWPLYMNSL